MSAITLYNFELDEGCYRVRLLLSMLGVEYKAVAVDMVPGLEEKLPPLLALNPAGALPILKDGDFVLSGTEAILAYIAKAYDAEARWLPQAPETFGAVMHWVFFSATILSDGIKARGVSLFGAAGDEDALRASTRKALRIMDDHMTLKQIDGQEWFAADHATIADLALFAVFALSRDFGIDHDEFPALRRWIRRFRTLKGFVTMPGIPDYH